MSKGANEVSPTERKAEPVGVTTEECSAGDHGEPSASSACVHLHSHVGTPPHTAQQPETLMATTAVKVPERSGQHSREGLVRVEMMQKQSSGTRGCTHVSHRNSRRNLEMV